MAHGWPLSPARLRLHREPLWLEATQDETRLRRAERDIRWLRFAGLIGWFVVLQGHGYALGLTPVWAIYTAGVLYAAWAHWQADRSTNIRRTAVITTFSDPVLAGMISLVTGGLDSVLYPFFYFTQMSVAIRFGVWESIGIAAFNCALAVLIYFGEPLYNPASNGATPLMLGTTLFLLAFAGFMGAILADWAREHASLILEHARTLRESRERTQGVLRRFAQVQEDERRSIAGELHDRMSGHLFCLRQGIEQCMEGTGDPAQRQRLAELSAAVAGATYDVRSIMNELRPTVLDELGFHEAASEYLARQSELSPYRLVRRIDPTLRDWRSKQDAMLFRLLQEALLNIQKHAQATTVEVALEARGEDAVVLSISDDGQGFDPAQVPIGHYGLLTMRERAEAAGGTLAVHAGGGRRGTRIEVRLPRKPA